MYCDYRIFAEDCQDFQFKKNTINEDTDNTIWQKDISSGVNDRPRTICIKTGNGCDIVRAAVVDSQDIRLYHCVWLH